MSCGWIFHSLGTSGFVLVLPATVTAAVAAAAGVSAAEVLRRRVGGLRRLRRALRDPRPARMAMLRKRRLPVPLREWTPVVAVGLGIAGVIGGAPGALVGAVLAAALRKWLRRRQAVAERSGGQGDGEGAELPLCADLMAACLTAGATPGEAAGAVGQCLGGPLGDALIRAQAELRLGADPVECWDRVGHLPEARAMGRCLARAATTGSAPVGEMTRLAAECRSEHARTALARSRRAAVLATAPLGMCFLPAFLLVGVAPVVMGLAGTVLGPQGH